MQTKLDSVVSTAMYKIYLDFGACGRWRW